MAWELDLLKEELRKKLYVHKYEVSFKHLYMTLYYEAWEIYHLFYNII